MESIIYSDTYNALLDYHTHLDSEAQQSQAFTGLYKLTSLVGLGLGGMTLATLTGWGLTNTTQLIHGPVDRAAGRPGCAVNRFVSAALVLTSPG